MKTVKPIIQLVTSGLSLALLASPIVQAEALDDIAKAVKDSKVDIGFRYRYEAVDQASMTEDAAASTLRTRLTVKTGQVGHFSGLLEADHVAVVGEGDYNSTTNGKTQYPVIADPKGTDLNQAALIWHKDDLKVVTGRQRILLDNQRFVGGVGWRQNEQTFDGMRGVYSLNDKFTFDTSYIINVNRIFSDDHPNKDELRGDTVLLNGHYQVNKAHQVTGYVYHMDFENGANASNSTYGLNYQGKFGPIKVKAAYAQQTEAGNSSLDYSADYINLDAGVKLGQVNIGAGYEVLGSDNGVGFQTPLATLHAFQGFADMFLSTPEDGIQDTYARIGTKIKGVKLAATYHTFSADIGNMDYGSEIDLVASYALNKNVSALLKYADFKSDDDYKSDTRKVWFMVTAKF